MNIQDLTVDEYTTPGPLLVGPEASVEVAWALMQDHDVRHLPVSRDDEVVGIISERDLRPFISRPWGQVVRVGDLMHVPPVSVPSGTPLAQAARLMVERKLGSLLVQAEDGSLAGIFTTTDALNVLVEAVDGTGLGRL